MNFELTIDDSRMIPEGFWETVQSGCETAMAHAFASVAYNNFGFKGEDRPSVWPALSYDYAKVFHNGNRIPKLQLTGDLQESIQIQESTGDGALVHTDNPYALDHQEGVPERNLPARPFFPMIGREVMPYTFKKCMEAANIHLQKILSE